MGIAMAALTRNKSGLRAACKAIPADVCTAFGKREEPKTWLAALTQGQAKAEFAAWLTAIEDRIGMLRAMAGQAYGEWPLVAHSAEVEKMSRYCDGLSADSSSIGS